MIEIKKDINIEGQKVRIILEQKERKIKQI